MTKASRPVHGPSVVWHCSRPSVKNPSLDPAPQTDDKFPHSAGASPRSDPGVRSRTRPTSPSAARIPSNPECWGAGPSLNSPLAASQRKIFSGMSPSRRYCGVSGFNNSRESGSTVPPAQKIACPRNALHGKVAKVQRTFGGRHIRRFSPRLPPWERLHSAIHAGSMRSKSLRRTSMLLSMRW